MSKDTPPSSNEKSKQVTKLPTRKHSTHHSLPHLCFCWFPSTILYSYDTTANEQILNTNAKPITNLFPLPKRQTGLGKPIRHHFAPRSQYLVAKRSVCRSASA